MKAALPIDEVLGEVVRKLRAGPNLVLRAPPGAGKTTRVPPAILDAGLVGPKERILMLQPRRIAARASARRIASERGGRVGDEIGYQIRYEDKTSSRTRIAVLTEGLLTRKLHGDPTLEGVGAVILDEFHERSIHADLAIAFLREIQESVRPELKIIVMSATLDSSRVSDYLSAPVIDSPGRVHPVTLDYLEKADDRWPDERVVTAVKRIFRGDLGEDDGRDILCFLPGAGEIRRAESTLKPIFGDRADILPLFGELDADAQDRAISRGSRRKIVLATNIAETSLTIDGVTWVVDSGLARVLRHDPARGGNALEVQRISRASADQRAGRAGRTAPGRALRLWTESDQARMPPNDPPEIARVDLAPVVLDVLAWGSGDPRAFRWFEAPPPAALERAIETLRAIGAVARERYELTPLGVVLEKLPVHPRLGAIVVEAHRLGVAEEGAMLAAVASERDPVKRGPEAVRSADEVESSDLMVRASKVGELEASGFSFGLASRIGLDAERARAVARARDHLIDAAKRALGRPPGLSKDREEMLLRSVLAGYRDRVAKKREGTDDRVVMVGGRGAKLAKECVVKHAPLMVVIDLDDSKRESESSVRMASAIEESWLDVKEIVTCRFNEERQAVETMVVRRYLDLPLEEKRSNKPAEPEEIERVLVDAAKKDPRLALGMDEKVEAYLARIELLRTAMPELDLPSTALVDLLPEIASGKRSFAEMRKVEIIPAIKQILGYKRAQDVERHAPEKLEVPSGSHIALRYDLGGPALAVRLQEVFGWESTPRVAAGRVPVKMELLAPNYRPVQVTSDLTSFWDGAYQEVRKELRAKYPRHSWPDNPREAPAVKGPRKRR